VCCWHECECVSPFANHCTRLSDPGRAAELLDMVCCARCAWCAVLCMMCCAMRGVLCYAWCAVLCMVCYAMHGVLCTCL